MLVHAHVISPGKIKWSGPHHTIRMLHFVLFHSVTCYTNPTVTRIHVNTTKLRNITCTLVATGVILQSLECTWKIATCNRLDLESMRIRTEDYVVFAGCGFGDDNKGTQSLNMWTIINMEVESNKWYIRNSLQTWNNSVRRYVDRLHTPQFDPHYLFI